MDPIKAVGSAIGGLVTGLFMPSEPAQQAAPPPDINLPPPIQPGSAPQGNRPTRQSRQPSFLSQGMVPMQTQSGGGGKTLLGQ